MGTAPVVPDIQQERTVLKKAGIAVAAAAVGLLGSVETEQTTLTDNSCSTNQGPIAVDNNTQS